MNKPFDVLVAGEINPDLILSGDVEPEFGQTEKLVNTATLTIGSSSAIFACGAAKIGLSVAFIGVCGDDIFGHFMLDEMRKRNVDVSNVIVRPEGQTGLSVILRRPDDSDRAILTHPGLIPDLQASDISDLLLNQFRHLHIASYFLQTNLQAGLPDLFQRAHSFDVSTSLDPNYDTTREWRNFDPLLSVTDVFLPNEKEALSITRADDVELAAGRLSRHVGLTAIKLGPRGGLACRDGRVVRADSIPMRVVDTVGAGDNFDAGFLYGYIHQWPLERSLRLACVCGALSTREAGGTEGQPTLDEAEKYVPG